MRRGFRLMLNRSLRIKNLYQNSLKQDLFGKHQTSIYLLKSVFFKERRVLGKKMTHLFLLHSIFNTYDYVLKYTYM